MRAIVQRISKASLTVDNQLISQCGQGLICYLAIGKGDTEKELTWLARKVAGLRIFPDSEDKMNLSVKEIDGEIMVVSQFTLYGDVKRGYRPSFIRSEEPDRASEMYEKFCQELLKLGVKKVTQGVFAADMHIEQHNQGPVTIILEKENPEANPN